MKYNRQSKIKWNLNLLFHRHKHGIEVFSFNFEKASKYANGHICRKAKEMTRIQFKMLNPNCFFISQ